MTGISHLVPVDDRDGFARLALVHQLSVLDDGMTVSTVVQVNLPNGVGAVEELHGTVTPPPLERREAVELGCIEAVAAAPVGATGATTAVGRLTPIGSPPQLAPVVLTGGACAIVGIVVGARNALELRHCEHLFLRVATLDRSKLAYASDLGRPSVSPLLMTSI